MLNLRAWLAVGLAVSVLFTGCDSRSDPLDAGDQSPSVEAATARGLAAAVMQHVDPDIVRSVSGSGQDGQLLVSVGLESDKVTSVFVSATEPSLPGTPRCGTDIGFKTVDCTPGPPFSEVVEKKRLGPRAPVYLGRAQTGARGEVLVEIFGHPSQQGLALVRALVADPLVGLETSGAINGEGEAIEDFLDLEIEREIGPVG